MRVGPCVRSSWPGYRGVRGPRGGDGGDAGKPGEEKKSNLRYENNTRVLNIYKNLIDRNFHYFVILLHYTYEFTKRLRRSLCTRNHEVLVLWAMLSNYD